MTARVFFLRRKFGAGATIFEHEQRVVAEAVAPSRRVTDATFECPARLRFDRAVGSSDAERAHETRAARCIGNIRKQRKQLVIVGLIAFAARRTNPRKTRAVHAGPPVERIDLEPRIIGQHRDAERLRVGNRLDARVLLERRAILNRFGKLRDVRTRV